MWVHGDGWLVLCRRFRGWAFFGSQPVIRAPESQRLVLRHHLLRGSLLHHDEIQIDALRGVVQFRWGSRIFERQIADVPLAGMQLILLARQGLSLGEYAVELRYGADRLLLVNSRNLEAVQTVYEQLAPFFPGAASDYSSLVRQADGLRQVCREFRLRTYFGPALPVARSPETHRMVLRSRDLAWFVLLLLGLVGGTLLLRYFIHHPWLYGLETITPHLFIGLLVLSLWAAYRVQQRAVVRIDALRGVCQFRWGCVPWPKHVEVPLRGLQLHLSPNWRGEHIYSLELQRGTDRLLLAKCPDPQPLQLLYEQLALFFPGAASNRAVIPRDTPVQIVQETPIHIWNQLHRDRTHYLSLQGNRALLRGSFGGSLGLALIAIGIPLFAWWLDLQYRPATGFLMSISLTVWWLSAFIAVIAWWIWPRTRVIEADGWLRVPGCQWEGRWRGPLHASDIAAVQVCDSREAYQVNLVTKGPEICRVNLLCDIDPGRAEQVASELARILRVPLQTPLS